VNELSKHVTVAVVGAGMAGQAHAFGYRNATMHPELAGVDVRLSTIVDFSQNLAQSVADRYGFATATRPQTWMPCSTRTPSTRSAWRSQISRTPK
jgi:predicted dehydrogenase